MLDETFSDDISQKRPIDEQVQAELSFVISHEALLQKYMHANDSIENVPNSYYRPFRMATDPRERIIPHDFFSFADNADLRKTFTVLVFLCDEITDLVDIVDAKIYGPLSMFGQTPIKAAADTQNGDTNEVELKPGERENMLGKFLPTLQEISNFIDRCYALALNCIQQLASLYNMKSKLVNSVLVR